MTLKQFKKLYDQVQANDKYIPGWQLMSKKALKTMWTIRLEQAGKAILASEKGTK